MTEKDKEHVFSLLDAFIAKSQFQGLLNYRYQSTFH